MRHKFRLAQLLKYRKSIEDQHHMELAMIEEKLYKEEEKLSLLQEAQRSCHRRLQSGQSQTAIQLLCLSALSQEAFSCRKAVHKIQEDALAAKERLIEASKSRKMVEKIRDREMERYKQYVLKQESKSLDEISSGRFVRANSGGTGRP